MSKRRGKLLDDAESIERRQWYADQQKNYTYSAKSETIAHYTQESKNQNSSIKELPPFNNWLCKLNNPVGEIQAILVCFCGIGQSHLYFKKWGQLLSPLNVQLYSICLPGRSNRLSETNHNSVKYLSVAVFYALKESNVLNKVDDDTELNNLVFFGHCYGALLAFETARLLALYKYNITSMIVSCCPSPFLLNRLNMDRNRKHYCYCTEKELIQRMLELGGIPINFQDRKELLKRFVPLFRSDYVLYDQYKILPPMISSTSIVPEELLSPLNYVTPTATLLHATNPANIDSDNGNHGKNYNIKNGNSTVGSSSTVKSANNSVVSNKSKITNASEKKSETLNENDDDDDYYHQYSGPAIDCEDQYPAIMYKVPIPIAAIRIDDDVFTTQEEVNQWAQMTNCQDDCIELSSGGHFHGLLKEENEPEILQLLMKHCGVD